MLYLNVDDRTYDVSFYHTFLNEGKANERRLTSCSIKGMVGEHWTQGVLMAYGDALHNPSDIYDGKKGEKVALTRALSPFPRDFRERFWRAFLAIERRRDLARLQVETEKKLRALKEVQKRMVSETRYAIEGGIAE